MLSKEDLANLLLTDVDAFNRELGGKAVDLSEVDFSGQNIEGAVFRRMERSASSCLRSYICASD
jgi:uncharacterized protein YjbI with pentapeptide repeats